MAFYRLSISVKDKEGWFVPVDESGEEDWLCPRCGHEHISCCGNSHFPCARSPQYGGVCTCNSLDDKQVKGVPYTLTATGDGLISW